MAWPTTSSAANDTARVRRRLLHLALPLALAALLLGACELSSAAPAAAPASPAATAGTAADATSAPTALPATSAPVPSSAVASSTAVAAAQPVQITGTFTYTNDIITTYYVEHMVALVDMYGFVKRDKEWEIPVDSQVLGFLKLDEKQKRGDFNVQLPERPNGKLVDVGRDGKSGVQIFVVAYWPNQSGGPFSEGDDRSRGWPDYLASTVIDTENHDEVIGGDLIVWAPDASQQFPTDFGADGRLFTDDDPLGPIPAGYAIVDLSKKPFAISQEAEPKLTLYEPKDAAIKDFSNLSYTEAFKRMFDKVRQDYAFNSVQGKEPPWDDLYKRLAPRVAEAEQKKDAKAFYLALLDFALAFHDGHVGLNGGQAAAEVFQERSAGGYGFAIRGLDDGRYIVTYVLKDGPAEKAGITVGAEVMRFDDKPIDRAVGEVQPLAGPFSTDFALKYQQQRYLLRAPLGTQASITFAESGAQPRTVTLTAVEERQSLTATSLFRGFDPNALPVQFRLLDSAVGYVKVNSNLDDLNLVERLFERALKTFQRNRSPGVIIDMRQNAGGAPLGLAGFFSDKTIALGQLEYYSDKSNKFEPEGPPGRVEPKEHQYHFDKLVLLVDQACFSACEIESYGFSQVPGMIVVGQYPSAGVEAEVARGQFELPEGMSFQVPTGRFTLPDGSLFLEGQGVQPTMRIPINQETVLSQGDPVVDAARKAIAGR